MDLVETGGLAVEAQLDRPYGIALDSSDNLYIVDQRNNAIRMVDAITGIITTVAGTGDLGFAGDGGLAIQAQLNRPDDVQIDAAGNVFISDTHNHRIRLIDAATGIISTVAGTGIAAFGGDGGPATSAAINAPESITLDKLRNLYIADGDNARIRVVNQIAGLPSPPVPTVTQTGAIALIVVAALVVATAAALQAQRRHLAGTPQ